MDAIYLLIAEQLKCELSQCADVLCVIRLFSITCLVNSHMKLWMVSLLPRPLQGPRQLSWSYTSGYWQLKPLRHAPPQAGRDDLISTPAF